MNKSIHDKLKEIGAKLDCHESDLYVKDSPEVREVLGNYENICNVESFQSQLGDGKWWDIPFANDDFWNSKLKTLTGGIHTKL